jgi:hypothetical protein
VPYSLFLVLWHFAPTGGKREYRKSKSKKPLTNFKPNSHILTFYKKYDIIYIEIERLVNNMDKLTLISKKEEFKKKAMSYAYDSLCLRYTMARNAQMELELIEDKRITGGYKQDAIRARAERDKMRFYEILDDVMGEHD